MNYIGSKLSLLEFLEESINKVVDKNCHVFCDLFAGTGIVGAYFKKKGYSVIANDIQYYSFVLNKQYIENHEHLEFQKCTINRSGVCSFIDCFNKCSQEKIILIIGNQLSFFPLFNFRSYRIAPLSVLI